MCWHPIRPVVDFRQVAQTYLDGTDLILKSSPANFKTRSNCFKMLRITRDHFLKRELNQFFVEVFEGKYSDEPVESMYAYIDPRNDRSKWMSENFGFKFISQLATQSFSRFYPKFSSRLAVSSDWEEIKTIVEKQYGQDDYFFTTHAKKARF